MDNNHLNSTPDQLLVVEISNKAAIAFILRQKSIECPVLNTEEGGYELVFKMPSEPVNEGPMTDDPLLGINIRVDPDEGEGFKMFPDGPPLPPEWLLALITNDKPEASERQAPTALRSEGLITRLRQLAANVPQEAEPRLADQPLDWLVKIAQAVADQPTKMMMRPVGDGCVFVCSAHAGQLADLISQEGATYEDVALDCEIVTNNKPEAPEAPAVPEAPTAPEAPVAPKAPTLPKAPAVPEAPTMPEAPVKANAPAPPTSKPTPVSAMPDWLNDAPVLDYYGPPPNTDFDLADFGVDPAGHAPTGPSRTPVLTGCHDPVMPDWMNDAPAFGDYAPPANSAASHAPTVPSRAPAFTAGPVVFQLEVNNEAAFEYVKGIACPTAVTPTGNYRLIFRCPRGEIKSRSRIVPNRPDIGLDVIAEEPDPSYQWEDGLSLADFPDGPPDAPQWLLDLIQPRLTLIPVREPLPEWPKTVTYKTFDWRAFRLEVVSKFSVAAYVKQEFNAKGQELIKVDERRNTFSYSTGNIGGGPFEIVCFKLYGHTEVSKHFGKVLKEAAKFAGVKWPDFRVLGCTLFDVLRIAQKEADNFYVLELEDDQYLSDVLDYNALAWGKVTHVIAGCGFGKTYLADFVTRKSFYTPMSRQAITFNNSANKRGAKSEVVVEGFYHDGSDSIFGTYDAAKKELALINDESIPFDISNRTCFLDEIQHLGHDAYRKSTALVPILKVSADYLKAGGRVVTLSGTPSPAYPGVLSYKGSDVIYVKRKNPVKRKASFFRQSDPVEAILDRIKAGYTHINYTLDDIEKGEAVARILTKALTAKGKKALPVHSKNKNMEHHKQYAGQDGKDGQWGKDVAVYITTRAAVDGFSVRINQKNARLAEMFDASLQYGSQMIEQRSERVRDSEADVFVGMKEKALEKADEGGHFDFMKELEHEFKRGEPMLNAAKDLKLVELERTDIEQPLEAVRQYILNQFKGWVRFDEDGEIQLDELAIIQRVTSRWVAAGHAVPNIMQRELEAYGFEFEEIADLTGNQEEAKAREDAIRVEKKARKEAELGAIKEKAQTMSVEQARDVREKATTVVREEGDEGKAKVAAAGLVLDLTEKGVTEKEAQKQISMLTSTRKDKLDRIEAKIQMAKVRKDMSPELLEHEDPKMRFFAKIQDGETFKLGEVLTSKEFVKRVRATAEACGIPEIMVPLTVKEKRRLKRAGKSERRYGKDREVMQLIKDIYRVKRTSKKAGERLEYAYEVLGFIEIELAGA